MADTAPAPAPMQTTVGSTRMQQVAAGMFPSNFMSKAVLFAAVVALLPLLPAQAHKIWEVPHLLLLGLVIVYGVFSQKNADAEEAVSGAKPRGDEPVESYVSQMMQGSLVFDDCGGDGGGARDGVQGWSSQYYPDDPLVVVASSASDGTGGASEKPLLLPVRRLKQAAEDAGNGDAGDGILEEEEFLASNAGLDVGDRAIPSPSSVLDADLGLSPCSPPPPPPPPPFLGRGRDRSKAKARSFNDRTASSLGMRGMVSLQGSGKKLRSYSAKQATASRSFDYDSSVSCDQPCSYEGADELDEMVAASDSSFSSDLATDADDGDSDKEDGISEDDGESCDEELFELATKTAPEEADEVDRKADEFIAKFREQIRLQRFEPAMT